MGRSKILQEISPCQPGTRHGPGRQLSPRFVSPQRAAPSSSGAVTKGGRQPESPARGVSTFSSSPLPKPGTNITAAEPKTGPGQGKPHRAPSWGASGPKSSREGAGGRHHRLFSRLHGLRSLPSPQKGTKGGLRVQHVDLCLSAPPALPRGGVPSPSVSTSGRRTPAGSVCCPVSPHAAEPRGGGNEGAGRAAPPPHTHCCPTASRPAP